MTKKHFIALADTIRAAKPVQSDTSWQAKDRFDGKVMQWEEMRDALADFCASQNPQFNRARWLDYVAGKCGPGGGSVKGSAS